MNEHPYFCIFSEKTPLLFHVTLVLSAIIDRQEARMLIHTQCGLFEVVLPVLIIARALSTSLFVN